jgi:CRISPR-associated protein Cmr4
MINTYLYTLHALSPLHAGTGQGTGVIDLPIAREKATGLPYLPGSSVKGTLRDSDHVTGNKELIFGPPTDRADDHAGAAQFADARLLLLPVRSLRGTFAWVTSPYVLNRFARDAKEMGMNPPAPLAVAREDMCIVAGGANLYNQTQVIIEDLDLKAHTHDQAAKWASWIGKLVFSNDAEWQAMLGQRLCVIHDNMLMFLLTTATEVIARIRLSDQKKTVERGALWYEEALPSESILAGVLLINPPTTHGDLQAKTTEIYTGLRGASDKTLQFGGKATVGRGLCHIQIGEAANADA